ncbi:MAG: hypothetical protein H7287_08520 [Thermoleophilia bacterium]|nr:hypothetical protein [Thermoleophilia bacterium]
MTRALGRAGVQLLAACTIALTGCGSSGSVSTSAYGGELRAATSNLADLSTDLTAATATGSPEQRATRLHAIQLGLRETGNQLDEVTAPAGLAKTHAELVAGVRDMADAIDDLVQAEQLVATDPERAKVLLRRFASDDSLPRVEAAAAKITKAGVDAGF